MGVDDFWMDALGDWASQCEDQPLSNYAGKRIAIDISIFINKNLRSDIDKLACTSNPIYKCPDLLQNIITQHEVFIGSGIIPVYVYDGMPPEVKRKEKERRHNLLVEAGDKYSELRRKVLDNIGYVEPIEITAEQLKEATESRLKSAKPTKFDQANILKWMEEQKVECYGSLLEADQQMVALEQDGIVDGIISEDGDTIVNGGRVVLAKLGRRNGTLMCKVFDRDEFMESGNKYNSKLCKYPDLIVDTALLLGNDYMKRIHYNGPATVLGEYVNKKGPKGPRKENGLIDRIAKETDKINFVNNFGNNGRRALTEQQKNTYWEARKYMLHAPVIRHNKVTNELYISPLNVLPSPNEERDWFVTCGLESIINDNNLLRDIYNCNILPLTRKSLDNYDGPFQEDGTTPATWFQVLDFDKDPIEIQPTICLVNWCRARRGDVHPERHTRQFIEQCARNCVRVSKPISDEPLKPITGVHDGFKLIRNRLANNPLDSWNNEFVAVMKNIQPMTDTVLEQYLDCGNRADRPSLHRRVKKLVESGNYHLASISCRNVESTEEESSGKACIVFRLDCLSSKTSLTHKVYAVFEDTKDGKYMINLSSCSCKKGQYFCSHLIGFLHIIRIVQKYVTTEDEFIRIYPPRPELLYNKPVPIETIILKDVYRRETAQSKRQRSK